MFSKTGNSITLSGMSPRVSGSLNLKMVFIRPQVLVTKLVHVIESKFQK